MIVCLFDAVGTLIYPHPHPIDVYHRLGRRFGGRQSRQSIGEQFAAAVKKEFGAQADPQTSEADERERWRGVVRSVLDDVTEFEAIFAELWSHFSDADNWRVYPDVAATLERLQGEQFWLGVASNFDLRLQGICRQLPPLDQIPNLFISSQLGWRKPSAEFFQLIQRQLPRAEAVWFVGDSLEMDVWPARRMGWQSLRIHRDATGQPSGFDIDRLTAMIERIGLDG